MSKLFIDERFVLTIIIVNAIAIFLNSFSSISIATDGILIWITELICALMFYIHHKLKKKKVYFMSK